MKIIDTHTHLNASEFNQDLEAVIARAKESGVVRVFNNGDSLPSFSAILDLKKRYPSFCEAVLGIHPEFAASPSDYLEEALKEIENHKDEIRAIGEIGLDYHYDKSEETKSKQKDLFIKQIRLAKELSLPIVIHSRDADYDTYQIIKEERPDKIDLHCYSGSYELYKEYKKLPTRTCFGIGGVVTFKNARVIKEVVSNGDIADFLTETDAPYLTPTPYRGKRNEPSYLPLVIEAISQLKGYEVERTSEILFDNGVRFYGIE